MITFNRFFYLHYLLSVVLFAIYSNMLIKDLSGVDQTWHYYQSLFLIFSFFIGIWIVDNKLFYILKSVCLIFTFPFLFNTSLNLLRSLPIDHLNKYDLSFFLTIVLLCAGVIGIFALEIVEGLNRHKQNSLSY